MAQLRASNGQYVDLRDYIIDIMNEREKAHIREHVLIDTALKTAAGLKEEAIREARDVVNSRLAGLNELRDEVTEDRTLLVTRKEFDLVVQPLQSFKDKAIGFGALLAIISGIIGSIIRDFFSTL